MQACFHIPSVKCPACSTQPTQDPKSVGYGFCTVCGEPHTINGLCNKHQPTPATKNIYIDEGTYMSKKDLDEAVRLTAQAKGKIEYHYTPATKPLDEQGIRTTAPHPLDKELDYILRTSPAVNLSVDDFYLHDLFVRLITLINDAEKQARIDELKIHAPEWVSINEDGSINPSVVYDRIKELENSKTI